MAAAAGPGAHRWTGRQQHKDRPARRPRSARADAFEPSDNGAPSTPEAPAPLLTAVPLPSDTAADQRLLAAGAAAALRRGRGAADAGGVEALFAAIRVRRHDRLWEAVDRGVSFAAHDALGRAPLHVATVEGNVEALGIIVHAGGCDVNLPRGDGRTALMLAAQEGHAGVLSFILGCEGVDIHVADKWGMTALHYAARCGDPAPARRLMEMGARVNDTEQFGHTPLHIACSNGLGEVARVLLSDRCTDATVRTSIGETPSQLALEQGHRELAAHVESVGARRSGRGGAPPHQGFSSVAQVGPSRRPSAALAPPPEPPPPQPGPPRAAGGGAPRRLRQAVNACVNAAGLAWLGDTDGLLKGHGAGELVTADHVVVNRERFVLVHLGRAPALRRLVLAAPRQLRGWEFTQRRYADLLRGLVPLHWAVLAGQPGTVAAILDRMGPAERREAVSRPFPVLSWDSASALPVAGYPSGVRWIRMLATAGESVRPLLHCCLPWSPQQHRHLPPPFQSVVTAFSRACLWRDPASPPQRPPAPLPAPQAAPGTGDWGRRPPRGQGQSAPSPGGQLPPAAGLPRDCVGIVLEFLDPYPFAVPRA
eukprot:TRINITY_DN6726_c0_g1_i1.p1 TRINITY_DN6726_c0_g1~~TRINITY_DN6726_c0_g1_i1.p1  ORF type:complete len:594 (+),score=153.24 TRINITY_DN6726_c0_g1_i1:84-1865(+)